MLARRLTAAAIAAVCISSPAQAGTRAYVLNGLFGAMLTPAMSEIGARLRARGATVTVGAWWMAPALAADACAHRGDRIVIIGHSLGATAAAQLAMAAKRCGALSVRVVGVDPPPTGARVNGVPAVNFVGALGGTISGASNVPIRGYGHIGIVNDHTMQARIVNSALH